MKNIIIAVLCFFSLAAKAQISGATFLPTTKYQGFNKNVAVTGQKPVDAKYGYYDTMHYVWSPFLSTAEANTFTTTAQRYLGLTVIINTGGTRNGSTGILSGGTNAEYWYQNSTADGGLALKVTGSGGGTFTPQTATDSSDIRGALQVRLYGNSLGYGTGGYPTTAFPGGVPYAEKLSSLSGYNVVTYAVPGQTSTQIKDRFLADIAADSNAKHYGYIFEMGTNNSNSPTVVKADIATCVAVLAAANNSRYLIASLPGWSDTSYWAGKAAYINITTLNSDLATLYGSHYVNVRAALVAAYNPELTQDVIDHSHDIPPRSLMSGSDPIHYGPPGYDVWAAAFASQMYMMRPTSDAKLVTSGNLMELFRRAPSLSAKEVYAVRAIFGDTSKGSTYFYDGNGIPNPTILRIKGAATFMNQTADPDKQGGIVIRENLKNVVGFANMSIMGTNAAIWTDPSQGFVFNNHVRSVTFGSDFNLNGTLTQTGDTRRTGILYNTGEVRPTLLSVGSIFHAADRPVDFSYAGDGVHMPLIYASQVTTKMINGNTLEGELFYNATTGKFMGSNANGAGFGIPRNIAYLDDVIALQKNYIPGAGLAFSGNSGTSTDPIIISNTTLPPANKLTGTYFGTSGFTGNEYTYAFDGNTSTYYAGNGSYPNYIGLDAGTTNVLTRIRIYPREGLGNRDRGAILQGSNTSTSTGYTNIYQIPTIPADNLFTDYSINNLTAYRYFRLVDSGSGIAPDVNELEFYGYHPIPPIILTTTGTGAATLTGTALNIPVSSGGTDTTSLSARINSLQTLIDSAFTSVRYFTDSTGFSLRTHGGRLEPITFMGGGGSGGGGGVSIVSSGNLSPLFTTSVASAGTTPSISYALSNAGGKQVFGNASGSSGVPSFVSLDTTYLSGFSTKVRPLFSAGTGISYNSLTGVISATGGGGGGDVYLANANAFTNNQTITGPGIYPLLVNGTNAGAAYITLNHNSGSSTYNTGLAFQRNGQNMFSFAAYANKFSIYNGTLGSDALSFDTLTSNATFTTLAGTGTRMVVASSTGLLSTQTIPSGGGVTDTTSLSNRINLRATQSALVDSMTAMRARDTASTIFNPNHFAVVGGVVNLSNPVSRDTFHVGHVIVQGTAPSTITVGSAAGTGGTATFQWGKDMAFVVNVTTGTSPTTGTLVTITPGTAFHGTNPMAMVQSSTNYANNLRAQFSTGTIHIDTGTALAASTSYQFTVFVFDY